MRLAICRQIWVSLWQKRSIQKDNNKLWVKKEVTWITCPYINAIYPEKVQIDLTSCLPDAHTYLAVDSI